MNILCFVPATSLQLEQTTSEVEHAQEAAERGSSDAEEQQEDRCVSAHGSFNMSTEQLTRQLEVAKREEQVERCAAQSLDVQILSSSSVLESLCLCPMTNTCCTAPLLQVE